LPKVAEGRTKTVAVEGVSANKLCQCKYRFTNLVILFTSSKCVKLRRHLQILRLTRQSTVAKLSLLPLVLKNKNNIILETFETNVYYFIEVMSIKLVPGYRLALFQ
jgi:hypothetical protein